MSSIEIRQRYNHNPNDNGIRFSPNQRRSFLLCKRTEKFQIQQDFVQKTSHEIVRGTTRHDQQLPIHKRRY